MNATIKKIKEKTGFSITTISQALNNPPGNRVKEETRNLIIKAAKKLKYNPNPAARALKMNKTGMISVIIPDITNFFYASIIRAIGKVMLENGYGVAVCDCDRKAENELLYVENSISRSMDGIIIATMGSIIKYIRKFENYPFVSLSSFRSDKIEKANLDYVLSDVRTGFYKVTSHLIKEGHKQIAFIVKNTDKMYEFQRIDGFLKAHRDNGLKHDPSLIIKVNNSDEASGYDAGLKLIESRRKFTAVAVYGDSMAAGTINAFRKAGLRVPEDIAVTGAGNLPVARYARLSTFDTNGQVLGAEAARALLKRIAHSAIQSPGKIIIEPELVIRESSLSGITNNIQVGGNRKCNPL